MSSTPYNTQDTVKEDISGPTIDIGLATTTLVGFYGVTPIVQRTNSAQAALSTYGAVSYGPVYGFATAAYANAVYTLANELRAALVAIGIIKGS